LSNFLESAQRIAKISKISELAQESIADGGIMAGFLSRLFGGATPTSHSQVADNYVGVSEASIGSGWSDIEVEGESYRRAEVARIFTGIGRPEGGVTMQRASLVPEPSNPHDRHAVKVIVRGEHVGYVPADQSQRVARACGALGRNSVAVVPARVWAKVDGGQWRARVTLSFSGTAEAESDYAADRRDWELRQAERAEADATRAAKRDLKEAKRAAGEFDGDWWGNRKSAIAELKRQKRFDEATELIIKCVEASENAGRVANEIPDPWPTEQMSVVLRRAKDYPRELEYLERYVNACGDRAVPDGIAEKLARARLVAERTD
jgi:hypothetical protein